MKTDPSETPLIHPPMLAALRQPRSAEGLHLAPLRLHPDAHFTIRAIGEKGKWQPDRRHRTANPDDRQRHATIRGRHRTFTIAVPQSYPHVDRIWHPAVGPVNCESAIAREHG